MNQQPLVSIVIPAFNPRFFAMALQSALAQTCARLEVVVCDDSQDDEIERIVRSFEGLGQVSLRYVRNAQRLGFVGNLVQAVELASGEFVKVLCDDDRLLVHCVEQQAQVLQEHAEVSLVLAPRLLADADNFILPIRLSNVPIASAASVFKGGDILSVLEGRTINFLGNFSAALMRREQALQWMKVLTQEGQVFVALLDLALFACLMRRGDMVMLGESALIERLHAQQLSKQEAVCRGAAQEWRWLHQMLASRTGEAALASGWVRYVPLAEAGHTPRQWQESFLVSVLSNWQTSLQGRVASNVDSYSELYQQWLHARRFSEVQRRLLPHTVAVWPQQPRIVPLVLDREGDGEAVRQTLESLALQLYPAQATVVLSSAPSLSTPSVMYMPLEDDGSGQVNRLLAVHPEADWIYLLQAGDRLSESALLVLAERIAITSGMACAYSDEGAWSEAGSSDPVFKPGFNIDLLRAYPYVGRALAFEREAAVQSGGFDAVFGELAPHDLLWRLVEARGPQVVEHIAEIQLQSTCGFAQWLSRDAVVGQSERVLAAHLQRLGVAHRIRHDDLALINRVDYLHGNQPLVSIVVVANDDLQALQCCVQSVIEHTAYPHYELLIVASTNVDAATEAWLAAMVELGVSMLRVLRVAECGSVAGQINAAARLALGEYLLLLSVELQAGEAQWLDELVQHAQRPEVAIVGAKVVNACGKVVEAGRVLGVGAVAGKAFEGEDASARGYLQRLQVVQNWSAVGGDCLMVRKAVFDDLGGLDTRQFSTEFGALDLCLKAGAQGYLVVWTPYALVQHVDSRGRAQAPEQEPSVEECQVFCERWLTKVVHDPAYNANLSLTKTDFSLEPSLHGSWNPLRARALPSILCLPINASAVGHYRVMQPFRALEAAGKVIGHIAHESPNSVQLARMDPDVIVLQLRHSEESVRDIERMARFCQARRIFEIDDYVLSAPTKNNHARNKPKDIEQHLRRGISLCDRLVVTTQALADVLSDMHRDIRVVPNMLAPDLWLGLQSCRATSGKPRVGWGGGSSHGGDLEMISEVVRTLAGEVEWVFFGMCPEHLKPYIHEFHPSVDLRVYPAKLASLNLDLALAPLEFHIFNDCKSNLRLLEYGACGYPVICSDTQAYRGNLPCTRVYSNSAQEWLQAIRMHLADPVASYQMGDALREAVMRDFVLRNENLRHWEWGWLAD